MKIAIALLVLAGLSALAAADEQSVTIAGRPRGYVVHLPNGRAAGAPASLVLVFHGGGGNADNIARTTAMDAKADREGFIAVYPNGTGRGAGRFLTWNAGRCCGPALDLHVDDVAFARAVVEAVAREYPVDRKRIYATGFSNGAMLSYRLACEMADIFAAIAPVSGALDVDDCRPAARVSIIAFHGTADQHVLFEGGRPRATIDRHERVDTSVAYAMDFWRKRDGCDAPPSHVRKGRVTHDANACADGTAVELYAVEGQGHAWPGSPGGARNRNADRPTQEISATDLLWEFFARHPKR